MNLSGCTGLMECRSVMYAIVTTKTKADIYHLREGGGLGSPRSCLLSTLEFLEIRRLWMAQEICDITLEEAKEE